MPFQIIRNDITKVKADAIVNTANPKPVIGSGTDSAVYAAAGEAQLLAERKKIGDIEPGSAVSTPAFGLNAKYIIHTVGPVWNGGTRGERSILRSCYANSLSLAAELACESIAFPMISTGVYGFPKDEALDIALAEIGKFLLTHEMRVILVVFDRKALELSEELVGEIREYIDEHSVTLLKKQEYGDCDQPERRRIEAARRRIAMEQERRLVMEQEHHLSNTWMQAKSSLEPGENADRIPGLSESRTSSAFPDVSGKSLDDVLGEKGETFQQRLFRLIDESGMDDVTVYKKANIDRKVFSRIRCKEDYKPSKKTAVAFAIALKLDNPTMLDLLSRAEIAFSPSSKFDLIVSYFITNKKYNIYEINMALFKYGQPTLGE